MHAMAAHFPSLALCLLVVSAALLVPPTVQARQSPNIIVVLTDDEDVVLGAAHTQRAVTKLVGKAGATFSNAFVTTPVCCPSRASLLSGRYLHNSGVHNNSVSGGCRTAFPREKESVATYVQKLGYTTGYFGKYLNMYGLDDKMQDWQHVPPGWNRWYALCGNSKYYDYNVSDQGRRVEHGNNPARDYFPHLVAENALAFIEKSLSLDGSVDNSGSRSTSLARPPFMAYIAPPSPHRPATPSPSHEHAFADWNAPRTPSFNVWGEDHHWIVREAWREKLNASSINAVDELYRNRLRTLLDIDAMVERIVGLLEKHDALDNTYIVYTSDHGYHLGQFQAHGEKRQPYETDIRVPLFARGPGIAAGSRLSDIALSIDLAPTLVDMAGGYNAEVRNEFDGVSILPRLRAPEFPGPAGRGPAADKETTNGVALPAAWRTDFLVEYRGEGPSAYEAGCVTFGMGWIHDCTNNTWNVLRTIDVPNGDNSMLADFTMTGFHEFYDVRKDPWELANIYDPSSSRIQKLQQRLDLLRECQGASCHE